MKIYSISCQLMQECNGFLWDCKGTSRHTLIKLNDVDTNFVGANNGQGHHKFNLKKHVRNIVRANADNSNSKYLLGFTIVIKSNIFMKLSTNFSYCSIILFVLFKCGITLNVCSVTI